MSDDEIFTKQCFFVFLINFCFVIHVFALEIVIECFCQQYLFYVQIYKPIIKMKS